MAKPSLNLTDESKSPLRTLFLLAWPVFLEQIFSTLVGYADTAMVGSLGASATASVSISQPVLMMLNGIVMALGVGITTLVARAVGAGNPELVKKLMHHAIMALVLVGYPINALALSLHKVIPAWMGAEADVLQLASSYNEVVCIGRFFMITALVLNSAFRGYGDTKTPMIGNVMMNLINVVFNFLLIYPERDIYLFNSEKPFHIWGAGLGVVGAAIATAIGMAASGLFVLWVAFLKKGPYRIDIRSGWKLDWELVKQIFTISLPAMLERIFMSSSGVITSRSIASLGTVTLAANSLCLTAESMSFMPAFAFQTAITTLVGQSLGAKKPELAERFVRTTLLAGTVTMMFTGAGLYFLAEPIIRIFTPDAAVIDLASRCLQITAFMQVPQVLAWSLAGVLRGAGDTKVNFYISAGTNWFVRTLWCVLLIRVFGKGLIEVEYVIFMEGFIRMLLLAWRYKTGKWKTIMKD